MQQKVRGGKLTPDDKAFLNSLLTELPEMKGYILKLLEDHDLSQDYKRQYGEIMQTMIDPLHEREQNFIEFVTILNKLFEEFSKSFKVARTHKAKDEFEREIARLVETRKRLVDLGVRILPVSVILHPGGAVPVPVPGAGAGAGAGAGSASAPPPPKAAAPSKSKGKKASAPASAAAAMSNAPDCAPAAGGAGCAGPAPAAPLSAAAGAPPPPPPSNAPDFEPAPPPPPPSGSKSNAPSLDGGRRRGKGRRTRRSTRRVEKRRRGSKKTLRR